MSSTEDAESEDLLGVLPITWRWLTELKSFLAVRQPGRY